MDKLKLIELVLGLNENSNSCPQPNLSYDTGSFLEVGKVYAFRTVTMIYTGRLKAINSQELLIEDAAWIPETERWAAFVATGAHREAEPYTNPVVLMKGALLDSTEIPSVIKKQK